MRDESEQERNQIHDPEAQAVVHGKFYRRRRKFVPIFCARQISENRQFSLFLPRAMLKGPKRSFVVVVLVGRGES